MTLRILIIDDEPRWISFAKNNPKAVEVVPVPNAQQALEALRTGHFDLVIASSLQLEAIEKIRDRYGKEQPIVVTTVEPNNQEARSAYRLGARRYITKSFNYDDLFEQLKGIIPIFNGP